MIETKQSIDVTAAVLDIIAQQKKAGEMPKSFWTDGEIPDKIGYVVASTTTHMRVRYLQSWLHSNGHHCFDDQLKALCLWHQLKGGRIRIPVLGMKYLILRDMGDVPQGWTVSYDTRAEEVAKEAFREHKEKTRR